MCSTQVQCPQCGSAEIRNFGYSEHGVPRYYCCNDEVFKKLKELLEPFGIEKFYTDDWGAYERHLE